MKTKVKELRTAARMTQQQLAERAGMQRVNVVQFETGTRDLRTASFDTVLRLAGALHVANPRKLLDDDDK